VRQIKFHVYVENILDPCTNLITAFYLAQAVSMLILLSLCIYALCGNFIVKLCVIIMIVVMLSLINRKITQMLLQ
jgi:hypothetical protein